MKQTVCLLPAGVLLQPQHVLRPAQSLIVDFLINGSGSVLFVQSMRCSDAAFIPSDTSLCVKSKRLTSRF